jgi:hypothetical protein
LVLVVTNDPAASLWRLRIKDGGESVRLHHPAVVPAIWVMVLALVDGLDLVEAQFIVTGKPDPPDLIRYCSGMKVEELQRLVGNGYEVRWDFDHSYWKIVERNG